MYRPTQFVRRFLNNYSLYSKFFACFYCYNKFFLHILLPTFTYFYFKHFPYIFLPLCHFIYLCKFIFSTFRLIMTEERSKRREFLPLVFIVNSKNRPKIIIRKNLNYSTNLYSNESCSQNNQLKHGSAKFRQQHKFPFTADFQL